MDANRKFSKSKKHSERKHGLLNFVSKEMKVEMIFSIRMIII